MSNNRASQNETHVFKTGLKNYKTLLDKDIAVYSKQLQEMTLREYGRYSRLTTDVYLDILSRGGKRIRGALTILGYEMCGGADRQMIIQAARTIEMIHAYMLIMDDLQDQSRVRRGGPAAHVMLAGYHRDHRLAGDAEHFGMSLAISAALSGAHAAQMNLANLNVNQEYRLKALSILNRSMIVTCHGQTNDIAAEVAANTSAADIENIMEWKTAHYSLLNPLHTGMVLAGAGCEDTDAITPYAINTGKAFQITDDILGTFGSQDETGKSLMDDMREGKRTLLTQYALKNTRQEDAEFLLRTLGSKDMTQAEFERCRKIIKQSGALDHARQQAEQLARKASGSLDKESHRWNGKNVLFLKGLVAYLLQRQS